MRLTKTVGQYLLGEGALQQIGQLLDEADPSPNRRIVYLIDHFFAADAREKIFVAAGKADDFVGENGAADKDLVVVENEAIQSDGDGFG